MGIEQCLDKDQLKRAKEEGWGVKEWTTAVATVPMGILAWAYRNKLKNFIQRSADGILEEQGGHDAVNPEMVDMSTVEGVLRTRLSQERFGITQELIRREEQLREDDPLNADPNAPLNFD